MAEVTANIIENLPKYGAQELKGFIRKYTLRGFVITTILFILLFLIILPI